MNKQKLLDLCLNQYDSYQQIQNNKIDNFQNFLLTLTDDDKKWWFGNTNINTFEDLEKLPVRSGADIIENQQKNPPYGLWNQGPMVFASSGSTNNVRKVFKRTLENYYQVIVGPARCLQNHGVNNFDTVMSTDPGGMFMGHAVIEDAAVYLLDATRVRVASSLLNDKITAMNQYGVTVLSGSPGKLQRMAKLNPKKRLSTPLKMLINTGGKLEHSQQVADAFGVEKIVDMYGALEIGNISWTCKHGHVHVNIDLCHIEQGKYFSNLTNLPIFRYQLGEEIHYSYKGTCACGSNLPTVDKFVASNTGIHKD